MLQRLGGWGVSADSRFNGGGVDILDGIKVGSCHRHTAADNPLRYTVALCYSTSPRKKRGGGGGAGGEGVR